MTEKNTDNLPDNFYTQYFGRMSDGRFMTNYLTNCRMNSLISKNKDSNMTSWQYKQFLINNTDDILNTVQNVNSLIYGCNNCTPVVKSTLSKYIQKCNQDSCEISLNNKDGLGIENH